ncbi:Hint domain-containing protein [Mesobacterium pallidum]|uniref:Hint domain-containing protein n=1 Tax=Mesobacterium pallidum TaxID=2872037 RepID=UPI001EE34925|nr:Hint domain-containing protein [Mesobacterium pallidum]
MPTTETYTHFYFKTLSGTTYESVAPTMNTLTDGSDADGLNGQTLPGQPILWSITQSGGTPTRYWGQTDNGDPIIYVDYGGGNAFLYIPSNTHGLVGTTFTPDYTAIYVYCFAQGTRIATPHGERPVESLAIGDLVTDIDGASVPVRWLGRQSLALPFWRGKDRSLIEIAAGALGPDMPHSPLRVTADHGILIDGVICHAAALVNRDTIRKVPADPGCTVYHVETERQQIILANGAPAETFIDNVARRGFDNYAEFAALYGDDPAPMAELPLPRAQVARQVPPALRRRLARRGAA